MNNQLGDVSGITIQRQPLDLIDIASSETWAANMHQAEAENISHWIQAIIVIKSIM